MAHYDVHSKDQACLLPRLPQAGSFLASACISSLYERIHSLYASLSSYLYKRKHNTCEKLYIIDQSHQSGWCLSSKKKFFYNGMIKSGGGGDQLVAQRIKEIAEGRWS